LKALIESRENSYLTDALGDVLGITELQILENTRKQIDEAIAER
jgi:hypothetical protein